MQPSAVAYRAPAKPKDSGCVGIGVTIAAVFFVLFTIFGIIASIAIPNFLNAVQRGKQKRTIADMNMIAEALEDYADLNMQYPDAKSMSELKSALVPNYLVVLPEKDAWENEFNYRAWTVLNQRDPTAYMLISFGKDGIPDGEDYNEGTRTTSFNNDIVLSSGSFLQYPEGMQP